MANTTWTMKLYDLDGSPVGTDVDTSTAGLISEATDRRLELNHNGIDQLTFALYLDDPFAVNLFTKSRIVKLWRNVNDTEYSKTFTQGATAPEFSGFVTGIDMLGQSNLMNITCQSPFWRLQTRFHLLNHYLAIDTDTGAPYKQSALMMKLIDLVNNAFELGVTGSSYTGISEGTFSWAGEPTISPYFVQKGSNTWQHIFENIMTRPAGVDITPRYFHTDGNPVQMFLDTSEKRGTDKSGTTGVFNYNVGADPNCDDMTKNELIVPGNFGNFVWVVGQGGPNSGKIVERYDDDATDPGSEAIGVYQKYVAADDYQRINDAMRTQADAELARARIPDRQYTATLSPAGGTYYRSDFVLGDVVYLNADKGAMSFSNVKQRIYQVVLGMSDNNMETAEVALSSDFYSKVAVTA